ncbi:MAG: hypothetical protein FWD19_05420 [Defluviitaleaceae bacterium]|nr:hypothetical protein [Defluviitaleaceae bacterium]
MQIKNLRKNFYTLCEVEPRLKNLEAAVISFVAENYKHGEKFDPDEKWHGFGKYRGDGIKSAMARLVGFSAANPSLATSADYDTAYQYLYALISDPNTRKLNKTN